MKKRFLAAFLAAIMLFILSSVSALADDGDETVFDAGRTISFYASKSDNELFGALVDFRATAVQGSWDEVLVDQGKTYYSEKMISVDDGEQPYCAYTYKIEDGYQVLTKTYNEHLPEDKIVTEGRLYYNDESGQMTVNMPFNGKGTGLDILFGKALRMFAYNTKPDGSGDWYRFGQQVPDGVDALYAQFVNPMSLSDYISDPTKDACSYIKLNGSKNYTEESTLVVLMDGDGQLTQDALYYTANLEISGWMARLLWSRTDEVNIGLDKTSIELTIDFADGLDLFGEDEELIFTYSGGFVPFVDGQFLNHDSGTENEYTITVTKEDFAENSLTLQFGLRYGTDICPTLTLDEFSKMSLTVEGEPGAKAIITDELKNKAYENGSVQLITGGTVKVNATLNDYFTTPQSGEVEIADVCAEIRKVQEEAVAVKPAPVTIYMGGEDGHDGAVTVVDGVVTVHDAVTLPVPGFTVEWPVENVDISELVFNAGEKSWKLESYDGVSTTIYKLVPSGTQDPIRMQFTNADNVTVTSDDFEVGANVNQTLTMQLYKDSVGQVTVKIGDDTYIVDSDYTADLTVRGTTAAPEYAGVNDDITADKPGLTAPEGTVYKINGKDVLADADTVALLFDDIIDTADENRTNLLWDEAGEQNKLPALGAGNGYGYEFKYLDLVDTHNGNVWVQASDSVTVYWPLPEGTDADTEFTLLHFKGLHREMASENVGSAIESCTIDDDIELTVSDTHVSFQIDEAGFSPFALVWQEPSPSSEMTVTKTADKDRIEVGETVTYTITVTNTGNQRLENISVTGVFSGRGELELSGETAFSLNPGESKTLTATYKALRADAGAILTNTVTAVCGELSVSATEKVKVERPWTPTPPTGGDDDDEPEKPEEPDDVVPPMLNGEDHYAYIIGYEDGTVRPNGQITRAEFATLFARFDESGAAAEGGFSDIANHWVRESIERAAALGWINGYEDGTFRPDNAITRAEAMTMINRVLNRDPVENDDLLPDMRVWSDNRPGAWYYFTVQEATNSHEYIRPDSHEDWTEMTPDPDWERYQ